MIRQLSFYRLFSFLLSFSFALLFFFDNSYSQALSSEKIPVDVTAKKMTYDKENDRYVAEGEVVLIHGGITINAEVLTFERKNNSVTAMGDVSMTDVDGNRINGELLVIDLEKNTGEINEGKLFFVSGNFHIEGEKIAKTGDKTYEIKKGTFTTCDCSTPEWSFSGADVKITDGEYLVSRKNFFYIKDLPVLYSPYVVLPVNRKRQTGFLHPNIGYSDLRGAEIDNSFFWAIADNRDATFYLDYMAKRGLGKGVEYRYIRKRNSYGELYFYHFAEKDIERVREFRTVEDNAGHPQNADDDRWRFKFEHHETLPESIMVSVDVDEVSDDEYFLDFGVDSEERALQKLESTVVISRQWDLYNLVTQFRYFDDLFSADDENTLQRLPEITLTGSNQPVFGTPLYISFDSSYNYFYRSEGIKGHRAYLHPRISYPLNPGGYFELTPEVGLNETMYWTNDSGEYDNRNLYDLSLSLQTTLRKIFTLKNGTKMKHSIRPNITYLYIPDVDQTGLPSFDEIDRISKENKISYSVTSYITKKWFKTADSSPSYRDTIFFEVSQSYDINEARSNSTTPDDDKRPFSDIKAIIILTPNDFMRFQGQGEYDFYDNQVSNYDLDLNLSDRRGDTVDVSYIYERSVTDYLNLDIGLNIAEGIDLFHRSRLSFLEGDSKTLETVFGVDYRRQCWGIRLSRLEKPDETVYFATINLLGLGDVASVSASFSGMEDEE